MSLRSLLASDDGHRADIGLDAGTLFGVIANERRRNVLQVLAAEDYADGMDLRDLSEAIASREVGVPIEDVPTQARKRVYVALYQTHIAQLDDVGLVDYGGDGGLVFPTAGTYHVVAFMDHARDEWGVEV